MSALHEPRKGTYPEMAIPGTGWDANMRCPYCGDTIHDPGLDRFCPSCGKEIPHESPDELAIKRDRKVSNGLLVLSITLIVLGGSFILPDIIIRAIDPGLGMFYWPYDIIVLAIGIVLLVARHPFAKRSRKFSSILLEQAQAAWTCSYCGAENTPGSRKCESCGAPLERRV